MKITQIGIDFGTTNTCVAVLRNGSEAEVLPLDPLAQNPALMRTLIYMPSRQESFFGKAAIEQYFERGMEGRFFQSIKKLLPNRDFSGTSVFGLHIGVEALVARFLSHLKKQIESQIGEIGEIEVQMGRPARYSLDDEQESLAVKRFEKAISLAGFSRFRLIDEPTAAAASQTEAPKDTGEMVLVCDLGGGTSDFTLFENGVRPRAVYGVPVAGDSLDSDFFRANLNPYFGSEIRYQRALSSNVLTLPTPFVKILPKWHHHAFLRERSTWEFILSLRRELVDEKQKPLLENLINLVEENLGYKLHQEVERIKVNLSKNENEFLTFKSYPVEIAFPVTKPHYESVIASSVDTIVAAALHTVALGGLKPDNVDALQFTGGTAQVPLVRSKIREAFAHARVIESAPFTAVAEGLAHIGRG